MASCPTNFHSFPCRKGGTRWHLVARIFIDSPAEKVGQDGILSHEFSLFLGEISKLVYDPSKIISHSLRPISGIPD